jgi:hypothetical protein
MWAAIKLRLGKFCLSGRIPDSNHIRGNDDLENSLVLDWGR